MSSLGDLFHALPAVHLLKTGLDAEVDWVAHDLYGDVVSCFRDVRRFIPFPRRSLLADGPGFFSDLRAERYDLVVDLQGLLKSAWVARLARGRRRIGPSFQREGARLFYHEVAGPRDKSRHAVEENLDVVRHLQLPAGPLEFPVSFPSVPVESTRPRVALLPCSRRAEKNWPSDRFIEVARALREQRGATIYLLGSPADQSTCDRVARALAGPVHNVCGRTTLPELGGLLRAMDLLISVDSGPMHMAAAVGTRVVAIFGPTRPERTGPYGAGHRVVREGDNLARLPAAPVVVAALDLLVDRSATSS